MAVPTVFSSLVVGKTTGSLELNQGNSTINAAAQVNCGSSGNITILCLVSSTQSNGDGIDYVTVGGQSLTAAHALQDWSADFGASRHRAFAATGLTITGNQNYTVGRNSGAGFGFDAVFVVIEGATSLGSLVAVAGQVRNATELHTATVSSNANSLIIELIQKDRKNASATMTTSSGSTTLNLDSYTLGFSVAYRDGAAGTVVSEASATVVVRGVAWSAEGASAAPVITAHPGNTSVTEPATANFTATATGSTSLQWQYSTDGGTTPLNVIDGTGGATGTTSGNYTTSATAVSSGNHRNGYVYRCGFTNGGGTTYTNWATLTVNASGGGFKPRMSLLGIG